MLAMASATVGFANTSGVEEGADSTPATEPEQTEVVAEVAPAEEEALICIQVGGEGRMRICVLCKCSEPGGYSEP